jgi:hypothetical protein
MPCYVKCDRAVKPILGDAFMIENKRRHILWVRKGKE